MDDIMIFMAYNDIHGILQAFGVRLTEMWVPLY